MSVYSRVGFRVRAKHIDCPLTYEKKTLTKSTRIIRELSQSEPPHSRRALLGQQLCELGDPRPGVGVTPDGLPDIDWLPVPEGTMQVSEQSFEVHVFYIARYPITHRQFQAFLDDPAGYTNPVWWEDLSLQHREPEEQPQPFDNHPRSHVSWYDATAFCRWLTSQLHPSSSEIGSRIRIQGWQVRLPTEWEWLQAAIGDNPDYRYPWGTDWQENFTQPIADAEDGTTAVGLYPHGQSPVGAMDMCSNLWEWCLNEYDSPAHTDIRGNRRRAMRGGRWTFDREVGTSLLERDFQLGPYVRTGDTGFRISCCPSE